MPVSGATASRRRQPGWNNDPVRRNGDGQADVCSDTGATRDFIVDRKTGFLVPPGDATAFCAAVMRLLADPDQATAVGTPPAAGLSKISRSAEGAKGLRRRSRLRFRRFAAAPYGRRDPLARPYLAGENGSRRMANSAVVASQPSVNFVIQRFPRIVGRTVEPARSRRLGRDVF